MFYKSCLFVKVLLALQIAKRNFVYLPPLFFSVITKAITEEAFQADFFFSSHLTPELETGGVVNQTAASS